MVQHLMTKEKRREVEVFSRSKKYLSTCKNLHLGKRCVIIGNGPSLNKMDLSFLQNEITFGLNKIYLGFDKWNFLPTYYVAVNTLVIEQSIKQIKELTCPKFISNRGLPYLMPQEDIVFIKTDPKPTANFSKEPTEGVNEGSTVTYVAMQLAYYMGFETVILIGIDHNFTYQGDPHQEVVSNGEDTNHFHPNYFGKGTKWNLPDLKTSEEYYKIAYSHFWLKNRQIVDATLNGKCEVFPKADYRQLFFGTTVN